jgi:hypothetical protein
MWIATLAMTSIALGPLMGPAAGAKGPISANARLTGAVVDSSGAVLPRVDVTLSSSDGRTRQMTTDRGCVEPVTVSLPDAESSDAVKGDIGKSVTIKVSGRKVSERLRPR